MLVAEAKLVRLAGARWRAIALSTHLSATLWCVPEDDLNYGWGRMVRDLSDISEVLPARRPLLRRFATCLVSPRCGAGRQIDRGQTKAGRQTPCSPGTTFGRDTAEMR